MLKHPGLTEYKESYPQKDIPPPAQGISVNKLYTRPVSCKFDTNFKKAHYLEKNIYRWLR